MRKFINCQNSKCGQEIISNSVVFYCYKCGTLHLNPDNQRAYDKNIAKKTQNKSKNKKTDYEDPRDRSYYSSEKQKHNNSNEKKRSKSVDKAVNDEIKMATILGLKGRVKKDDIKKAYRRKIREYHPDKVESMGQEIKDIAAKKTKEINEAYEHFKLKYFK